MKTKYSVKPIICFLLIIACFFTNPTFKVTTYAASKVKISKTKMTLFSNDSQSLKITGTSEKATWTSSDENVAKVSSKGKVKALNPGNTTITAAVAGKKLKCKVTVYEMIGTYYCAWNVNWDPSPANRHLSEDEAAEVRYAINLLFDRSHIANNIVGEGLKPASTFVAMGIMEPDGGQFYKHAGPKNKGYYPTKAQKNAALKILKKYYTVSNGKVTNFPEIKYIFNGAGMHETIAKYLQSRLRSVGIKMSLKSYEWKEYTTVLSKGKFSIARSGWAADVNDANNFLEMYVAGNADNACRLGSGKHASASIYEVKLNGIGKYKNLKGTWKQTYQKLISYIRKEKKADIRNQLLHKAEDLLMETGCICPLYYYTR